MCGTITLVGIVITTNFYVCIANIHIGKRVKLPTKRIFYINY